jgi:hypothetical protein
MSQTLLGWLFSLQFLYGMVPYFFYVRVKEYVLDKWKLLTVGLPTFFNFVD